MDYGINSASALNQKNYAAQGQAVSDMYAGANAATAPVSASEAILSRLDSLRMSLSENCSNASNAADKIVGTAPTPINQTGAILGGVLKAERPPASCFIDALQQVISDLEITARDTREHLNHIHRSF